MKNSRGSKYKRLIQILITEIKRVLRPYSGKFSKKTYTQYQHATAICLMKYENKSYRDTVELLKEFADYFVFKKSVPHFTTLQKFFKRVSSLVWDFILIKTYQLFNAKIANVGIDSTGFKQRHSSSYYTWAITQGKYKHRRFMKHSIAVDTDRQAVIASEIRQSGIPDGEYFVPLVKKVAKVVKINNIVADKGYDYESNHDFARDEIGAFSVIPPRWRAPAYRTTGRYRKKLRMHFPYKLYHRRNLVETINSVQKRKFGDELRSRLWHMRRKELKIVDIVYNVHRYLQKTSFVVIIGFLLNVPFLF